MNFADHLRDRARHARNLPGRHPSLHHPGDRYVPQYVQSDARRTSTVGDIMETRQRQESPASPFDHEERGGILPGGQQLGERGSSSASSGDAKHTLNDVGLSKGYDAFNTMLPAR
ncbi:MAG TPA: hypothetical protein VGH36_00135, partial [Acetobacteraceae bacterium]